MRLRPLLVTLGVAATAFAASPAVAAHATGSTPVVPVCVDAGPHTVVTDLVNRPDFGHGTPAETPWALDTIKRTVTISQVKAPAMSIQSDTWSYQAVVTDEGTFVTKGGEKLSPNKGANLVAGTKGTVTGSFTVDFTAGRCFAAYGGHKGDLSVPTSKWVAHTWGGEGIHITTDLDSSYKWTYKTCSESWLDAYNNKDGQAADAGDITGKVCPVTPTTAPAVVPVVQPSATPGASAAASLPVTGSNTGFIAGAAVLLVGVGVGLFMISRRRLDFKA